MTPTAQALGAAEFVLVTTFRRDGSEVPTPMWVAPVDGGLGVWTAAGSGKVKRVRRSGTVTVAECDRRGAPLGPAVSGTATLLDIDGTARVRRALRRKYGLVGRALTTVINLRRGRTGQAALLIALETG